MISFKMRKFDAIMEECLLLLKDKKQLVFLKDMQMKLILAVMKGSDLEWIHHELILLNQMLQST